MPKINTLVFSQARSGTGFMKSLINQNSNLNMHNINTSYLERGMTLSEWFTAKKTNNFMIYPELLTLLPKRLVLGAEKHVYFIRKDIVAQSVSRVIADVIGYRKHLEIPEPEQTQLLEKCVEDPRTLEKIYQVYTKYVMGHTFCQKVIDFYNLAPYILYYEDLCEFPKRKTSELFKYLGVNVSASEIKPPDIQRQTTPYNEKLINRYKNSTYYQQNRIHDILDPKYQLTY